MAKKITKKSIVGGPWEVFSLSKLLLQLGEDLDREGLQETPERVRKAWEEMLEGYTLDPHELLAKQFDAEGGGLQIAKHIAFTSMCEHHLLPFHGIIHVGYVPKERVVGLSKIARLVDCFSKRLQIQERLVNQIADAINDVLEPESVIVICNSVHLCCKGRGIRRENMTFTTTATRGNVDLNLTNLLLRD